VEHDRETLNYYWDFEQRPDVEEDNFPNTDWNQVRIDAAISAMQGIISKNDDYTYKEIAVHAVGYAEALVKELKKQCHYERQTRSLCSTHRNKKIF
jgi:hypothetical protein